MNDSTYLLSRKRVDVITEYIKSISEAGGYMEALGSNVYEIAKALSLDPRFFDEAGMPKNGSCEEIDWVLRWNVVINRDIRDPYASSFIKRVSSREPGDKQD